MRGLAFDRCPIAVLTPSLIPLLLIAASAAGPIGPAPCVAAEGAPAEAKWSDLPNPFPRELAIGKRVAYWDFEDGTGGWNAVHDCAVSAGDGKLQIESTGNDPYLVVPSTAPDESLVVRIRMKHTTPGAGQLFWATEAGPITAERSTHFELAEDGRWHEYQALIEPDEPLTHLRLDPGTGEGRVEIDWLAIHCGRLHPLEITGLRQDDKTLRVALENHARQTIDATVGLRRPHDDARHELIVEKTLRLPPGRTSLRLPTVGNTALERLELAITAGQLPPLGRRFWIYRPDVSLDAVERTADALSVQAARDGSVVRLSRHGKPVAALAPLLHIDGELPKLQLNDRADGPLEFRGKGVSVTLDRLGKSSMLQVRIRSNSSFEGPVVRVFGSLEQGLLAGIEHLGHGEHSSSTLDIETDEHLRVRPEPRDLTVPLAAVVTPRASVALLWEDTRLQPVFAVPDFLDGAPGHRMALEGTEVSAVLRIGPGWKEAGRIEEAILWAVRRRGLPPLPEPPRTFDEQRKLSLAAYHNMIHDDDNGGWFHAVVPGVRRMPEKGAYLADCVSAIWKLSGEAPKTPTLQPGGAHIPNPAAWFVTGRADQWLAVLNRQAESLRRRQQPDGSFRYDGRMRRGHFENTASGVCARPAWSLLRHAMYTGNVESLQTGLKALAFLKRFRTPRGAQTWEVPLHTPDILASAYAVWANVLAFRLTGQQPYLDESRRWALSGLPFVYQWSNRPTMHYATVPVLGATHWKHPNWIGLPVQWCGLVYAYALLMLSEHDQTLDWAQVAEGILICGEQMQYPEGPSIGCLPDVFSLPDQRRRPANINPGALLSLRLKIAEQLDGLAFAADANHRVVSPFPVTLSQGHAHVDSEPGVAYQLVINGARVVDVAGQGNDVVPLEP